MNTETTPVPESLLRECVEALRHVAENRLPELIDHRLLWLSQNKDRLSPVEDEEQLALVEMAHQWSVRKARAQELLRRLEEACPRLHRG
jgi:hypothetical protein